MTFLGEKIQKALPKIQPRIECLLGIPLGDIEVLPLPNSVDEILKNHDDWRVKVVARPIMSFLAFAFELSGVVVAKAGNSAVYYNRNPFLNGFLEDIDVDYLISHELGHTAHARIMGESLYSTRMTRILRNRVVSEGFAEYMAHVIRGGLYDAESIQNSWTFKRNPYGSELSVFKRSFFSSNKGLIDFVRSSSSSRI